MLTRTDMQLLALRAMFDLPFYLMVFGAALLELRRPRGGWPVLLLLALAGLLRPEAWLLGGVYWLWLARELPRQQAAWLLPARASPRRVLWMLVGPDRHRRAAVLAHLDARGLGRVRPQPRADRRDRATSREYSGRQRPIVTVGVGGLGLLLAVYILRRRAALPRRARRRSAC